MRKTVTLNQAKDKTLRLMVYTDEYGTYLFKYDSLEDCGAFADVWFPSHVAALEACEAEHELTRDDWTEIGNPPKFCQFDWINPVRIKGRDKGKPEFGKYEKLVDGEWIEI